MKEAEFQENNYFRGLIFLLIHGCIPAGTSEGGSSSSLEDNCSIA